MRTIELETPPGGFEITQEWKDMPDSLRRWARPLWRAVRDFPTTTRVPFTCGTRTGKLRKSWGRANNRGKFVIMETDKTSFVIDFKKWRIKIQKNPQSVTHTAPPYTLESPVQADPKR